MNRLALGLVCFFSLLTISLYATDITTCTTMNSANTEYDLVNNIDNNSAVCMTIAANNVTFDCKGYYINSTGSNAEALHIDGYSNNTVKNCVISTLGSNQNGIVLDNAAKYNLFTNLSITVKNGGGAGGHCWAEFTSGASYNNLTKSFLNASGGSNSVGVVFVNGNTNNYIYNNTIYAQNQPVYFGPSTTNTNNVVDSNFLYSTASDGIRFNNGGTNSNISNNYIYTGTAGKCDLEFDAGVQASGNLFWNNTLNITGTAKWWCHTSTATGNSANLSLIGNRYIQANGTDLYVVSGWRDNNSNGYADTPKDNATIFYALNDTSLRVRFDLDNESALGENNSRIVDYVAGYVGNISSGAFPNQTGVFGGGLSCDGTTNGKVDLGNLSAIPSGGQNRTICLWAVTSNNGVGSSYNYAFSYGTWSAGQGIAIGRFGSGNVVTVAFHSSELDSGTWTANVWKHICYTYNNVTGNNTIWINGAYGNSVIASRNTVATRARVCGDPADSFGEAWNGTVDSIRVWNRTLSSAEITSVYNGPGPKIPIGNSGPYTYYSSLTSGALLDWHPYMVTTPPSIVSVSIAPALPDGTIPLTCSARATSPNNAVANLFFSFLINGSVFANSTVSCPVSTTCDSGMSLSSLSNGQVWTCSVFANDTFAVSQSSNVSVTIISPFVVRFSNETTTAGFINQTFIYVNISGDRIAKNLSVNLVFPNGTSLTITTNNSFLSINFTNLSNGNYLLVGYGYSNDTVPVFGITGYRSILINVPPATFTIEIVLLAFLTAAVLLLLADLSNHPSIGIFAAVIILVLGLLCLTIDLETKTGSTTTNSISSLLSYNCTNVSVTSIDCLKGNGNITGNNTKSAQQVKSLEYAPISIPYLNERTVFGLVFILLSLIALFRNSFRILT